VRYVINMLFNCYIPVVSNIIITNPALTEAKGYDISSARSELISDDERRQDGILQMPISESVVEN